ncbi:MAG: adenine deaminase [Deltaproteobacteria bacterium]|jgi:adenine deaminase|nr:adenine deaminase [Deltaproteobacteria bacterium]
MLSHHQKIEIPQKPKESAAPLGLGRPRSASDLAALIETAMGRRPAELAVKNAQVYNPYLGAFQSGTLAVAAGRVAALGEGFESQETFDAKGGYLISGLIDSHVHIESSMTAPWEFARSLCATGLTAVIADPHEIATVAGLAGLKWLMEATENLPVDVYVMAPSCVPATHFERGGGQLGPEDIFELLKHPRVLGLAEVMNFPGVIGADKKVLAKMEKSLLIDGHAPGLSGRSLSAYVGAGIRTDHECFEAKSVRERISLGQRVLLREGTAAKNLLKLLPALTAPLSRFCHLCTDDRHAGELARLGSINSLLAMAVKAKKLPLPSLLNMATLNPAEHYGLRDSGSLAPGRAADFALYPDLESFKPAAVWKSGQLVAENGKPLAEVKAPAGPKALANTVAIAPLSLESLEIRAPEPAKEEPAKEKPSKGQAPAGKAKEVRVIGVVPGQIVTKSLSLKLSPKAGLYAPDPKLNLAKMAVWERYGSMRPPAVGLIKGLGLKSGAVGTTVSHDSHNLAVAGISDADMLLCAKALAKMGGGLAVTKGGAILGRLALPLGGLMSEMSLEETAEAIEALSGPLEELGFPPGADPFMTLSFMSLPVIPSLKLTASGLVDVEAFKIVPLIGREAP